jgi:hypothetical protein
MIVLIEPPPQYDHPYRGPVIEQRYRGPVIEQRLSVLVASM